MCCLTMKLWLENQKRALIDVKYSGKLSGLSIVVTKVSKMALTSIVFNNSENIWQSSNYKFFFFRKFQVFS